MRKILSFILVISLLLTSTVPLKAVDYSEDEDYWYDACNGRISSDMLTKCQGFTQNLKYKQDKLESK